MVPMGDLEDGNDKVSRKFDLNLDFSDVATQQVDCQYYPGCDFRDDGATDFHYCTDTMPNDDTFLLEDSFQTQLADLAGETQPMDLAEEIQLMDLELETQLLDFAGETQVLDDVDCAIDVSTKSFSLPNVDIAHGTDKIEVICDTQKLSQDDFLEGDDGDLVTLVNEADTCLGNRCDSVSRTPADTFNSEEHHSGSVVRGFTSIRTSSMRASGLASRVRGFNSCGSEKSSLEQLGVEQQGTVIVGDLLKFDSRNNEGFHWHVYDNKREKPQNPNESKPSTKRELFAEDRASKAGQSKADISHTYNHPDIPESHDSENFLAGLSYVNTEEPGELSQAIALEAVDRFLQDNAMEYGSGLDYGIHPPKEASAVNAIGSRDLAKSSILKNKFGECRAYDWDDTREDDGGGDFFQKKRELFYIKESPNERSFTEPRKFSGADIRSNKTVAYHGIEKKKAYTGKESRDPAFSDSGLILHKMGAKKKSLHYRNDVIHNDLTKDLSDLSNMASACKLPEDDSSKNIPNTKSIGPDTQMAVEAMETLCYEVHLDNSNVNGSQSVSMVTKAAGKKQFTFGSVTRSSSSNHTGNINKQQSAKSGKAAQRRRGNDVLLGKQNLHNLSCKGKEKKEGRHREKITHKIEPYHGVELNGHKLETKQFLVDQLNFSVPVAHRTRKWTKLSCLKSVGNKFGTGEEIHDLSSACVVGRRRTVAHDKNAEIGTAKKFRNVRSTGVKKSNINSDRTSSVSNLDTLECVTHKRTQAKVLLDELTAEVQCNTRSKRSRLLRLAIDHESSRNANSDHGKVKETVPDAVKTSTSPLCDGQSDILTLSSAEGMETIGGLDASPSGKCGTSFLNCTTTCAISRNDVSPICMGNEYYKLSCRKNLPRFAFMKEVDSLITNTSVHFGGTKELRKRKDNTNIRVLFSQHLDVDVVKQQKKILTRLGASDASSMLDASHFVADEFVRTRNMLEAIAFGRPVVTHLWLESCGQTNCFVNEKSYILRDARKEKEFGFSMPVSLSRACQLPLLLGQKVLVTQNTKPGKDIIMNLVKAVHGLAVERLGRSSLKDEKLPDDLLILSCEEDYDVCIPFLEKGGAVYSSELLLNGIVKQKLEFERYRLFADQVRRTRSTIWVKRN